MLFDVEVVNGAELVTAVIRMLCFPGYLSEEPGCRVVDVVVVRATAVYVNVAYNVEQECDWEMSSSVVVESLLEVSFWSTALPGTVSIGAGGGRGTN